MIRRPDVRWSASAESQNHFLLAMRWATLACLCLTVVFVADAFVSADFLKWGLRPRQPGGLLGIFSAPLLHASWGHLFSNLIPLGLGLTLMLYLYPRSTMRAIPMIYLGSGTLTWLLGRSAIHVGASGVVYGLLSFLFLAGFIRRDARALAVALVIAFVYGAMIWGLLPWVDGMSWELHLTGCLAGLACAVCFRTWDQPTPVVYDWDDEP